MDAVGEAPRSIEPERRREHAKRRRPSGEAPPLPRSFGRSGRFWSVMVACFLAACLFVAVFSPAGRRIEGFDVRQLIWISRVRTHWLTRIGLVVNGLGSAYTIRGLRWAAIAMLIVFRRWRHLVVFLGSLLAVSGITYELAFFLGRARPLGVTILTGWQGYSMPSIPV